MNELTIGDWEFYASVISGWSPRASSIVKEKLVDGYSVAEISERYGVTKQCVYSSVKRYKNLISAINENGLLDIKVCLTPDQAKIVTKWSNENKIKNNRFIRT